jgi:hypothetical protein
MRRMGYIAIYNGLMISPDQNVAFGDAAAILRNLA